MKTKKCTINFHGNVLEIPAGLRVSPIMLKLVKKPWEEKAGEEQEKNKGKKMYFLDEFPKDLFPRNSMILHDATHYGVRLNEDQVELTETKE